MPITFTPDKKINFTPDKATIDFVPDKPRPPLDASQLSWSAEGPGHQDVMVGPRTAGVQPVKQKLLSRRLIKHWQLSRII